MLLTCSGRSISIRFFREYPKRSLRSSRGRSSASLSEVARSKTGSVGGIARSIVWNVIMAKLSRSEAYHVSILGINMTLGLCLLISVNWPTMTCSIGYEENSTKLIRRETLL